MGQQNRTKINSSQNNVAEALEPPATVLSRILFIGFGKILGFSSFEWLDKTWPNAADYEAIFIDTSKLFSMIVTWQNKSNVEDSDTEIIYQLSKI